MTDNLEGLIADQCDAIALQAEALKTSPLKYRTSRARRILSNAETLMEWVIKADTRLAESAWDQTPDPLIYDYPEGSLAICRFCHLAILLDQREGGGPGKDWGACPEDWVGNGGIGMDYGCGDNPESDDEGSAGHEPEPGSIKTPTGDDNG